jgi:hypothetical protein
MVGQLTRTVHVGMRRAEAASPCYVYEITGAEAPTVIEGKLPTLANWVLTLEVACVADTVDVATDMADDLIGSFTGVITDATNKCKLVLAGVSVALSAETPDDGKQDAERIATATLTIIVQETP